MEFLEDIGEHFRDYWPLYALLCFTLSYIFAMGWLFSEEAIQKRIEREELIRDIAAEVRKSESEGCIAF